MIDYETASKNLQGLVEKYTETGCKNEAETRFHYIDVLLTDCLGWERADIPVEKYLSGERSDYELGSPTALILEAKRDAVHFEIPVRKHNELLVPIRQLMGLSDEAKAAVDQVQGYCARRGVRYAAICNGPQLIVFVATRIDGKPPFEGRALVIDGFKQLQEEFPLIFNLISPLGATSNKLLAYLDATASPVFLKKFQLGWPIIPHSVIKARRAIAFGWSPSFFLRTSRVPRNWKSAFTENATVKVAR